MCPRQRVGWSLVVLLYIAGRVDAGPYGIASSPVLWWTSPPNTWTPTTWTDTVNGNVLSGNAGGTALAVLLPNGVNYAYHYQIGSYGKLFQTPLSALPNLPNPTTHGVTILFAMSARHRSNGSTSDVYLGYWSVDGVSNNAVTARITVSGYSAASRFTSDFCVGPLAAFNATNWNVYVLRTADGASPCSLFRNGQKIVGTSAAAPSISGTDIWWLGFGYWEMSYVAVASVMVYDAYLSDADIATVSNELTSALLVAPPPITTAPTATPTASPTTAPTFVPTAAPTTQPSFAPTAAPTAEPTSAPTSVPTAEPTAEPTSAPTAEPTAEPTSLPTSAPTSVPTAEPTAEPTSLPTSAPTSAPTAEPTSLPTSAPTAEPTSVPTSPPTSAPTADPTAEPTLLPSTPPSSAPSSAPTSVPSEQPTALPSAAPTASGTLEATSAPTALESTGAPTSASLVVGIVSYTASIDTQVRAPTATQTAVQLDVSSGLRANPFADSALRALESTVTLAPPRPIPACTTPLGLESSHVEFGLRAAGANGTLPFPLMLNFSHAPGFTYLYARRARALYLCNETTGTWKLATSDEYCGRSLLANWGLSVLLKDRVPDPHTFLLSYTCHNTEFALLQALCSDVLSDDFVRTCNDCIEGHWGCSCEATSVSGDGYADDTVSKIFLGFLCAAAGLTGAALQFIHLGAPPGSRLLHGEEDSAAGAGDADPLKCECQLTPAELLIGCVSVWAVCAVLLSWLSPGAPHTSLLAPGAFLGLSAAVAVSQWVLGILIYTQRERWAVAVFGMLDVTQLIVWAVPSLLVSQFGTTAQLLMTLLPLLFVQYAQQMPHMRPICGSSAIYLLNVALTTAFRVLLWLRVPCE